MMGAAPSGAVTSQWQPPPLLKAGGTCRVQDVATGREPMIGQDFKSVRDVR